MSTSFRLDVGSLEKPVITSQGYLKADCLPTRVGIFDYMLMDGTLRRELRHPDEVFNSDSINSLQDVALTNDHPPVPLNAENTKHYQVGHTSGPISKMDKFVRAKILITDKYAIDEVIGQGKHKLSCGYHCELDETPGEWNGEKYDAIQRNIRYNHLSIVWQGRAGPEARINLDAKDGIMQPVEKNSSEENKNVRLLDSDVSKVQNDQKGDLKMSITLKVDAVQYELPENLAPFAKAFSEKLDAFEKVSSELKAKSSELEKVQGKLDGLTAEMTKKDSEIENLKKAVPSEKEMAKLAKGRLDVQAVAKKVLGETFNSDELETLEIKKKIIEKAYPEAKLDGRSAEYVEGVYDSLQKASKLDGVSQFEQGLGQVVQDTANGGTAKNDSKKLSDFYQKAHLGKAAS